MLHTFHDGSSLAIITAQELIAVPVWKGNRTLDMAHAERLAADSRPVGTTETIRNAASGAWILDIGL